MDCLQQCRAEKVLEKIKWATINHSKNWSASKEIDIAYLVGSERHCVFPSTNLVFDKYCSQLGQLKTATEEISVILSNNFRILHQTTERHKMIIPLVKNSDKNEQIGMNQELHQILA